MAAANFPPVSNARKATKMAARKTAAVDAADKQEFLSTFSDRETSLKLICEVKKCPWIYDVMRSDHKDAEKRDNSWTGIAKEMGIKMHLCQRKWSYLRDQYRREIQKRVVRGDYESKWPYLESCRFLSGRSVVSRRISDGATTSQSQCSTLGAAASSTLAVECTMDEAQPTACTSSVEVDEPQPVPPATQPQGQKRRRFTGGGNTAVEQALITAAANLRFPNYPPEHTDAIAQSLSHLRLYMKQMSVNGRLTYVEQITDLAYQTVLKEQERRDESVTQEREEREEREQQEREEREQQERERKRQEKEEKLRQWRAEWEENMREEMLMVEPFPEYTDL